MIKCYDWHPGFVTLTPNDNSFLFKAVDVDKIIFATEDNVFGIRRPEVWLLLALLWLQYLKKIIYFDAQNK